MSLLLTVLEWAVSRNIKIIHLSLGTEREEHRADLEDLCAHDRDVVILAVARSLYVRMDAQNLTRVLKNFLDLTRQSVFKNTKLNLDFYFFFDNMLIFGP